MSYDTDKDFDWVMNSLRPRGQIPGGPPQELPHIVSDVVAPRFDAFAWQRYGALVFETANALNNNIISLTTVASGFARYYPWVQIRAAGGAPVGPFWIAISDGTNPVAVSDGVALVDGQASSPPKRGVLVPAGFLLQARSSDLPGVAVTMFIEAFSIALNTAEYILPT